MHRAPPDLPDAAPTVSSPGFTLVELLIVVILLAIVAAIVVPAVSSERTEAVVSALKANVSLVSMTLEYQRQKTPDGSWPSAVDQDWFASARYPYHPDRPEGVPQVEDTHQPGQLHPSVKLLTAGSPGAYWYNAANGVFRARVYDQGTADATLEMYNRVNQTQLGALGGSSGPGNSGNHGSPSIVSDVGGGLSVPSASIPSIAAPPFLGDDG